MKLVGMLDSPYVRRVAISFEFLGVEFDHEAVSVFTNFEEFKNINPVVKAPTLVCDNGVVLMDSSLIIQFIERAHPLTKSLWPTELEYLQHAFRAVSLSLAVCDKCVQLIYERNLRPSSHQYEAWLTRVSGQAQAALQALEKEVENRAQLFSIVNHASIASAVTWQFVSSQVSEVAKLKSYPCLTEHSQKMENLAEFKQYPPLGPGVLSGD